MFACFGRPSQSQHIVCQTMDTLCTAPCRETALHTGRQSPKSYTGKTPTHPGTPDIKKSVPQAGEVHFCDQKYTLPAFYLLQKPRLVQPKPIWAAVGRIVAPKSPENCRVTRRAKTKRRQNHPIMGFGGILDCLKVVSIPSGSIAKGIKNKNFCRFWVPRYLPP